MRFLKGLQHMFSPSPFIMTQSDFNLVLTFLMCSPFEPMNSCPLRLLTIKTVFLVAITSARRVSELQALSFNRSCINFYPDKLVLSTRASFLPKVVTLFQVCQTISLPMFFAPPRLTSPLKSRRDFVRIQIELLASTTIVAKNTKCTISFSLDSLEQRAVKQCRKGPSLAMH